MYVINNFHFTLNYSDQLMGNIINNLEVKQTLVVDDAVFNLCIAVSVHANICYCKSAGRTSVYQEKGG